MTEPAPYQDGDGGDDRDAFDPAGVYELPRVRAVSYSGSSKGLTAPVTT